MTGITSLPPSLVYRNAERSGETGFERFKNRRDVQSELQRYLSALSQVQDVDGLFRNRRALEFVARSTGITSELQFPGRLQKALLSDRNDPDSLINRLNNPRLIEAARTLRLREDGVATLKDPETIEDLTDAYLRTRYEQTLAEGSSAVTNARYFKRQIADASDNVFEILGDRILRDVVTKTLGLPLQLAVQSVDSQGRAVTSRLDISRFSDPKFVDQFIQRYLSIADQEQRQEAFGGLQSPILSLLQPIDRTGQSIPGFNVNLLA